MKARVLLVASFVCGGALSLAFDASALNRRLHGSACMDGNHQYYNMSNQNSSGQNQPLYCAIPDDTYMLKETINVANIHVYQGSSTAPVYAWACVSYWNAQGGACGNWVSANSPGNVVTLSPPRTYWTQSYGADFGHVYVTTPQYSVLQGIYLST